MMRRRNKTPYSIFVSQEHHFVFIKVPGLDSDDDDEDDGGHLSPVHGDEPQGPNPQDMGEGVLQGLPPSPSPLYPIHSDDEAEAEATPSAMDISEAGKNGNNKRDPNVSY